MPTKQLTTRGVPVNVFRFPSYTIPEAALYLRLPVGTLRSWLKGRHYWTQAGKTFFNPLIAINEASNLLSFHDLVEAHILAAIRRDHKLDLPNIRRAIDTLQGIINPGNHPLSSYEMATNGVDLFTERYGELINLGAPKQLVMKELMIGSLKRIKRDPAGLPMKLFPFTRTESLLGTTGRQPEMIVIDPTVSFGRPTISGTGIATTAILSRYRAGEDIKEIADDYGVSEEQVQEAIRLEIPAA